MRTANSVAVCDVAHGFRLELLQGALAMLVTASLAASDEPSKVFRKDFERVWSASSSAFGTQTFAVVLGENVPAAFWYGRDATLNERREYTGEAREAYFLDVIEGEVVDREPRNASVQKATLEQGEVVELIGVGYAGNRIDLYVKADEDRSIKRSDTEGRLHDMSEPVATTFRFHIPLDPSETLADADQALAYVERHLKPFSNLDAAEFFSSKVKSGSKRK